MNIPGKLDTGCLVWTWSLDNLALGLWMLGRLDSACLESGFWDSGLLDTWTLDAWTLGLGTLGL